MMGLVRDAQLIDPRPPGMRRVEARHVPIWIHHAGAWRKGAIHCWFVYGTQWAAWLQHDPPDEADPQAVWGMYVYDGETIRRRYSPAARASVEVSVKWGPQRTVQTRLRDLGYAAALIKTGDARDIVELG